MRPALLVAVAVALMTACGCGTVMNLAARPGPASQPEIVPDTCYPFGGVRRSSLLGVYGVGSGVFSLCTGDITGAGWVGVGAVSLADTPVSLAGDVVTLPVAFVRRYEMPLATWWGWQGWPEKDPLVPGEVPQLPHGVEGRKGDDGRP